jgi:hypothetical protein
MYFVSPQIGDGQDYIAMITCYDPNHVLHLGLDGWQDPKHSFSICPGPELL